MYCTNQKFPRRTLFLILLAPSLGKSTLDCSDRIAKKPSDFAHFSFPVFEALVDSMEMSLALEQGVFTCEDYGRGNRDSVESTRRG